MTDTAHPDLDFDLTDDLFVDIGENEGEFIAPVPEDDDLANQLCRARYAILRTMAEDSRVVEAEIGRLNQWLEDRNGPRARRVEAIERSLENYARAVNSQKPKKKTWNLPNGRFGLKAARASTDIVDEDALIEWAKANGRLDLLKIAAQKSLLDGMTRKLDDTVDGDQPGEKILVSKLVDPTSGEVVPGAVTCLSDRDGFSVGKFTW